jgi:dipeptidyl-peptidase-4
MTESFPRQQARTRRFTLGAPRAFQVSPDGERVTFLRSKAGDDPVTCLWQLDVATGTERLVADPRGLGADDEDLPPEERARRERVRETAAGIVAYNTDKEATTAVFSLSGQVYSVRLDSAAATPRIVGCKTPALDPRIDPTGRCVAYVHAGALYSVDRQSGDDVLVAAEAGVTFGLAEFVAAEEMHRSRGYWWSPDGCQLLLTRVDESPVARWHIAEPATPDKTPAEVGYPAAGTANADVRVLIATLRSPSKDETMSIARTPLAVVPASGAHLSEVHGWDRSAYPYLVNAAWGTGPVIVVQTRDQKAMRVINALTGDVLREDRDSHWTDVIPGVPAQLADGRIVWTGLHGDSGQHGGSGQDTRGLIVASPAELATATPVTPDGLQVMAVIGTDGDDVLFSAAPDPTELGVWRFGPDGLRPVATAPGLSSATASGGTTVVLHSTLESNRPVITISRSGWATVSVASHAQEPSVPFPAPQFIEAGPAGIRTAVLLPSWHQPGTKLPVLMDPYGGPGMRRVVKSAAAFLASQWLAEQGFAVVVADNRGTPGRTPSWERQIDGDLATGALEDQVTALAAAAEKFSDLDTARVGIRGWSFGGYLAALAVLRRPDVFKAAVAGAPVTDWRLYDTHYTERYLGDPATNPSAYRVSSLLDDPAQAVASGVRPLLIIHGLADDNVFVAHSLRLSSALLAAGYPHSVLPLSGITHMTPQEVVAENMLLFQVAFLKQALGVAERTA